MSEQWTVSGFRLCHDGRILRCFTEVYGSDCPRGLEARRWLAMKGYIAHGEAITKYDPVSRKTTITVKTGSAGSGWLYIFRPGGKKNGS